MKSSFLISIIAFFGILCFSMSAYAQSEYTWGSDANGNYIRLYDEDHNPLRVYIPKAAMPLKIGREKTANRNKAKSSDPLSPFGPRKDYLIYYNSLSDKDKKIYEAIYETAKDMKASTKLPHNITEAEATKILTSVIYDHPELFWLDWFKLSKKNQISLSYFKFDGGIEEAKKKVEEAANKILRRANRYSSNYEKLRYINDVLGTTVTFGEARYSSSIYSALVDKKASSYEFSDTFQYLANRLGLPSHFVNGYIKRDGQMEPYAWAQVMIYDQCYNFDPGNSVNRNTYTDSSNKRYEIPDYSAFGRSDSELRKMNMIQAAEKDNNAVKIPECGKKIDYLKEFSRAPFPDYLVNSFNLGERNVVNSIDEYYSLFSSILSETDSTKVIIPALVFGDILANNIKNLSDNETAKTTLKKILNENAGDYVYEKSKVSTYEYGRDLYFIVAEFVFKKRPKTMRVDEVDVDLETTSSSY